MKVLEMDPTRSETILVGHLINGLRDVPPDARLVYAKVIAQKAESSWTLGVDSPSYRRLTSVLRVLFVSALFLGIDLLARWILR